MMDVFLIGGDLVQIAARGHAQRLGFGYVELFFIACFRIAHFEQQPLRFGGFRTMTADQQPLAFELLAVQD